MPTESSQDRTAVAKDGNGGARYHLVDQGKKQRTQGRVEAAALIRALREQGR